MLRRSLALAMISSLSIVAPPAAPAEAGGSPSSPARPAFSVTAPARVVDGDTLDLGLAENVRPMDFDAPESRQTCRDAGGRGYPCGRRAATFARDLIAGRPVTCTGDGSRDRYGRPLAICRVDGVDIGAQMVRAGWALAATRFSDRYEADERAAVAARAGMHAGSFEPPWTWRAMQRAAERTAAEARAPADPDCRIKGNISRNGRLYHLPRWRSWPKTRIDEAKGERWFCSEAEARAAGWRPARR